MNKVVFLDRDGTINIDKNYQSRIDDFEFFPDVFKSLKMLHDAGYLLIIINNQSGVARGLFTEDDVNQLHAWLLQTLSHNGIKISGIYYCPHHSKGIVEPYNIDCECRKPKLSLFYQAIDEHKIDIDHSFAIGDRLRDLSICLSTGCRGFIIGNRDSDAELPPGIIRVSTIYEAASFIVK